MKYRNTAILAYHRIGTSISPDPYGMFVSVNNFRRHLSLMAKKFDVVSLKDLCAKNEQSKWFTRPTIALTIDDDYKDAGLFAGMCYVNPSGHPFPITMFLNNWWQRPHLGEYWWDRYALQTTFKAGADPIPKEEFQKGYRLLQSSSSLKEIMAILSPGKRTHPVPGYEIFTAEDVAYWSRSGFVTIGAHTQDHLDMTVLTEKEQAYQIQSNIYALFSATGEMPRFLSYPFGKHNASARRVAGMAGMRMAVTTDQSGFRLGTIDPMKAPRIVVHDENDEWLDEQLQFVAQPG